MNTWIWHEISLELGQIDVEGAIEAERGSDRRDNYRKLVITPVPRAELLTLCNQTVEVLVVGTLDAEISAANVVDSLVVNHEAAVGVLKSGMGSQDGVVWLDNGCGDLGCWVDAELQLALLAIIDGQTLHEQSSKARSSSTTERVKDEETLETSAIVRNTANFVKDLINKFFANSVVTPRVVVGRILLASDHLLGVEKGAIGAGADLIHNVGLEIAVDSTRNIFAIACNVLVSVLAGC